MVKITAWSQRVSDFPSELDGKATWLWKDQLATWHIWIREELSWEATKKKKREKQSKQRAKRTNEMERYVQSNTSLRPESF